VERYIDKTLTEYSPGELVAYKQNGICRIEDIRSESFGDAQARPYYIMRSLTRENTVVYVPADTTRSGMHRLLTRDEIDTVITQTEYSALRWIDDSKERAARFTEIIAAGCRSEILWVVKALSLHRVKVEKSGHKFYISDERILAAAKKAVVDEFAFVLGISSDEVIPYIMKRAAQTDIQKMER